MTGRPRDDGWMGAALVLARRGLGTCWPNPSVGCVIVKSDRLIGRGRTQPGGRPHAEVVALAAAGAQAKDATAYVTLEPCSHHGQTPPCTDALIKAGVARVVIGAPDPNPKVSGVGALRAAGISVDIGIRRAEATHVHRGFFCAVTKGRPHVTLKLAVTLDGQIATGSGESRWITGTDARRSVHLMRASNDAVLIGRGTAEADDPMLDVRALGPMPQPVRIVFDRKLSLGSSLKLLRSARMQPTWIVHDPDVRPSKGYEDCNLIEARGLPAAFSALGRAGLTSVLCEGGATLAAALLQADLVDELVVYAAGKVIGADGIGSVASLGLTKLVDAPKFVLRDTRKIGDDVVSVWSKG